MYDSAAAERFTQEGFSIRSLQDIDWVLDEDDESESAHFLRLKAKNVAPLGLRLDSFLAAA